MLNVNYLKMVGATAIILALSGLPTLTQAATPQATPTKSKSDLTVRPNETISSQVVGAVESEKNVVIDKTATLHQAWGEILNSYIQSGEQGVNLFDYAALKANPKDMSKLDGYIQNLAAQKPSTMSPEAAMAYWANLYNALTVQVVVQNYPVKSIRKIRSGWRAGPWRRKLVTVEGETLTLDNIEHDILLPTYQTPMVHYMVNCASIGCPNLKATPWQAATIREDLDAAARTYVNSPRGFMIKRGRLQASSIYGWFRRDFGGGEKMILEHIKQFVDPAAVKEFESHTKIYKYYYDWNLNAPKSAPK